MEQWSGNVITKFISISPWLEGWALLCCCFFFNRRRSHCAQPIQYEQQGRCGAQKCHGELWLKLQLPTPSPCVLPAESVCSKAKSETLAQTWVSKFLCCCWILRWDDGCLSLNGWCFPTASCCASETGKLFSPVSGNGDTLLWSFWELISSCTVGTGLLFNGNGAYLFLTNAPLTIELFMCVLSFPFYFLTY